MVGYQRRQAGSPFSLSKTPMNHGNAEVEKSATVAQGRIQNSIET